MKYNWTKCLALLPLFGLNQGKAQGFTTTEYLDINHFKIAHLVHGDMWYDAKSFKSACEFPKGSGRQIGSMLAIWSSASDSFGNKDYVAAQSAYRSKGSDFWPGPLDARDTCTYDISENWARIWKVNQKDIDRFNTLPSKTIATIPANILEWPAKGNPYAKGNAGASLSISEDMAPFTDVDGDGNYNPLKGDYPRIKGEQMLWWIFNDNGSGRHSASGGRPMKLEYRASAYAYKRGGVLNNVVYYEFDMVNKSAINYIDFRFGYYVDPDVGLPFDDYLASDSAHRMGITYEATFRENSFLVGISIVEVPGDVYPGRMKGTAVFTNLDYIITGLRRAPRTPVEYYNYMHGKDADGVSYADSPMEFPVTKGGIMCDEKYPFIDKRYYLNTSGFDFPAKSTRKVAMALLATDTTGNACGGLNFKELGNVADTAWKVYYNPLPALSTKEVALSDQQLRVYPNPAEQTLYIDSDNGKPLNAARLKVYDATGRQSDVIILHNNRQLSIDVSRLTPGLYALVYSDGEVQAVQQFVKK